MKELVFEELTTRQKLGMVYNVLINGYQRTPERDEQIKQLIRDHCLGSVWIQFNTPKADEIIQMVKEVADYPILIITDAEAGMGDDYTIGKHNALSSTGDEKYAYAFGKAVGVTARKMGYNVVCNPLVDINDNGSPRYLSPDKKVVARFAAAEARGMQDAGILTVGKHYPSAINFNDVDSHMAQSVSVQTKEELLDQCLYAYCELNKEGLLDGVMTGHIKCEKIDPDRPSSLSKPVLDLYREQGFDGFMITDALCMMAIRSQFTDAESSALCIEAGNDIALPYLRDFMGTFEELCKRYEEGVIPEERLNEAVKRVLAAQHKANKEPKFTELTEEEHLLASGVDKAAVYVKTDDGVSPAISRDGKHLFVLMTRNETEVKGDGKPAVDTFSNGWHYPAKITDQIKELFPNSEVKIIHQFPNQSHCVNTLEKANNCDDTIFLTFSESLAYVGREHLTRRAETLIEAVSLNGKLSTLVHFGNPTILGNLPHIGRIIFGGVSEKGVEASIEVLAGVREATGVPTFELELK